MTPAARLAAAAEILDTLSQGVPAEQVLTRWARQNRYAGSKDRAAVRDHVFDVLRQRETCACLGGGTDGRAYVAGLLRAQGVDPGAYFTGQGHAPAPLTDVETARFGSAETCDTLWNLPQWLIPELRRSLGDGAQNAERALRQRAPVTLRVNLARADLGTARTSLQDDAIATQPNPLCPTALTVVEGARRLRNAAAYTNGLVELQDAASQAVVAGLPAAARCLDYCAGGGGKALALAAQTGRAVWAHDIDPARMKDLAPRAARAGCRITELATEDLPRQAPFDLVLCDAPCSGSGAWRRSPDAKWAFTQDRLAALCNTQDGILQRAAALVAPGGTLAYATCSLLRAENEDRIAEFIAAHPGWTCTHQRRFDICPDGDGFYVAHLTHAEM